MKIDIRESALRVIVETVIVKSQPGCTEFLSRLPDFSIYFIKFLNISVYLIAEISGHTQTDDFNLFPVHINLTMSGKANVMKILIKSIFQNFQ